MGIGLGRPYWKEIVPAENGKQVGDAGPRLLVHLSLRLSRKSGVHTPSGQGGRREQGKRGNAFLKQTRASGLRGCVIKEKAQATQETPAVRLWVRGPRATERPKRERVVRVSAGRRERGEGNKETNNIDLNCRNTRMHAIRSGK